MVDRAFYYQMSRPVYLYAVTKFTYDGLNRGVHARPIPLWVINCCLATMSLIVLTSIKYPDASTRDKRVYKLL